MQLFLPTCQYHYYYRVAKESKLPYFGFQQLLFGLISYMGEKKLFLLSCGCFSWEQLFCGQSQTNTGFYRWNTSKTFICGWNWNKTTLCGWICNLIFHSWVTLNKNNHLWVNFKQSDYLWVKFKHKDHLWVNFKQKHHLWVHPCFLSFGWY